MATKVIKSTHGKQLLSLLSESSVESLESGSLDQQIQVIMEKDRVACRLPDAETGNNAVHIVLGKRFPAEATLRLVNLLCSSGVEALSKANNVGDLPLHHYLLQRVVTVEVLSALVSLWPNAAAAPNRLGLIPLFLAVMRDDIPSDVVKVLCKSNPVGPSTFNSTHSYPLHFAAKKTQPNAEIIRILLRRHAAAAQHTNDHGLLPLHCAAAFSNDEIAVQMIYEAFPGAIQQPDRQGRLPLHLAVLAVGMEHASANAQQMQQQQTEREEEQLLARMQGQLSLHDAPAEEVEDDVDESNTDSKPAWIMQEVGQRSRRVVRYLAEQYPQGMMRCNNFLAVPVDTVLSKEVSTRTRNKIVSVFGLFKDPITARLLLLLHRDFSVKRGEAEDSRAVLPSMCGRHREELCELNWHARRPALLASYQGQAISTSHNGKASKSKASSASSAGKSKAQQQQSHSQNQAHPWNLTAQLRQHGLVDLVRLVVGYL